MATYNITTLQTQFPHGDVIHYNTTKPVSTWRRNTLQHYNTIYHMATITLQHYKASFHMATYYVSTLQTQVPHGNVLPYNTINPVSTWRRSTLQHYKSSFHIWTTTLQYYNPRFHMATYYITTLQT